MSQLKQKLEDLKESIPVGDDSLEAVRDMLGSAAFSVNGAPDKLQAVSETVGHLGYVLGKLAIRETSCPMKGPVNGKLAVLYPFRWPLAVVLAPAITAAVLVMGGERVYNLLSERAKLAACAQYEPNK